MGKFYHRLLIGIVAIFSMTMSGSQAQTSPDVLHYNIHLTVTDFGNQKISGHTEIFFMHEAVNIGISLFELWNLNIDSIQGQGIDSFSYDGQFIHLFHNQFLTPGDTQVVTIFYQGQPMADPTGWGGFRFMSNIAFNLGVGFGADPHNLGKSWYPCVDTFTDRASYDFYITTAANHKAICGGLLESIVIHPSDSNLRVHHWRHPELIPTYLASVAVGNFEHISDTFQGINSMVPVDLYLTPNLVSNAAGSFVHLEEAFHAFEEKYGPYRWSRVGYVSTPVGAMEHSCNIAYPFQLIDGATTYERTMAHELAHMWFGNLITAHSSQDMWINEGWASFLETDFMEYVYGFDYAKAYNRARHASNLRTLHHTDGLISLYGVGHEHTYSNTVYKKGADMAQTLKGYLGSDLFYSSLRNILSDYAFNDVSVANLRDYLSVETGVDLIPFFNAFLYQPGWLHFRVDSFSAQPAGNQFEVEVYLRQSLKDANQPLSKLRLPLGFLDQNLQLHTEYFLIDNSEGMKSFLLDFQPVDVILDPDEQIMDATTDKYFMVYPGDGGTIQEAYFKYDVGIESDSAWLRVEQSWIAPDPLKFAETSLSVSDSRYWKVQGWLPEDFDGTFMFNYNNYTNTDGNLDNTWFPYPLSADSLVLLFREGSWADWVIISSERLGPGRNGYLSTHETRRGEYTLAYRDRSLASVEPIKDRPFRAFPNPAQNTVHLEFYRTEAMELRLISATGKVISTFPIAAGTKNKSIDTSMLSPGNYFLSLSVQMGNSFPASPDKLFRKEDSLVLIIQ